MGMLRKGLVPLVVLAGLMLAGVGVGTAMATGHGDGDREAATGLIVGGHAGGEED